MKILLACNAGMSTSLLMKRMQQEAEKQGKKYKIWALDIDSIEDEEDDFDICMIGPQVGFRLDEVKELVETHIPVVVMDKRLYGACDGAALLEFAEETIKNKEMN